MKVVTGVAERAYGALWELRRHAYARGLLRPQRVQARVVSVGNLTVGGTGKTTLTLHLAREARARGIDCAVVCRRYRPGPKGEGDEERMYRALLPPASVFAGASKRDLAREAAPRHPLVLVDDGFSHWGLERDLDLVLLEAADPFGGGRLLPAGRMREPRRALQRASFVVLTRLAPDDDPLAAIDRVRPWAPGARFAAGRHQVTRVARADGVPLPPGAAVWVLTATGNPEAVAASALESGFEVRGRAFRRDHHWFRAAEIEAVRREATAAGALLLVTSKDAVRWPLAATRDYAVIEVGWRWLAGGDELERAVFVGGEG